MKRLALTLMAAGAMMTMSGKFTATVSLQPSEESPIIEKEIYGQFAEHLGSCIYGGLWVGPDSPIPNQDGYRLDVLNALKELSVPVLRWPGGCFADEYHWMDGIGPMSNRKSLVNNNWGGTTEDNSFGTHEFFNLCELLECEPYLCGNVGSGTVQELADWVAYITSESGYMAELRKANGREKPWHLKYLGVGNESWGCGGNFTPEYYSDVYRRYQTYCRDYNGNHLYKIASGASDYDYNWTDVMMKNAGRYMDAISLHYYTVFEWNNKTAATKFDKEAYYRTLGKCLEIKDVVRKHCEIMDKYDPNKRIGLLVDEWGTWWDEEPGTTPGHLFQQNTMRDAMVAALTLDVFHTFTDRVKMTNIAQIVNVLQAMILTQGDQMVLTPTYYVFKMYKGHQDGKYIPLEVESPTLAMYKEQATPSVSATASTKDNVTCISLTNVSLDEDAEITINMGGISGTPLSGEILTAKNIDDYNDFNKPEKVSLKEYSVKEIRKSGDNLIVKVPAKSILTLKVG